VPSFTVQLPNLLNSGPLVTVQVAVGSTAEAAMQAAGVPTPSPLPATAMIDTGASASVIRQGVAAQLGLYPIGVSYITTPSSTNVPCNEYLMRFVFPNQVVYEGTAIETPLQGQNIDCLIGRDILAHAVLVYIGYGNQFTLSF